MYHAEEMEERINDLEQQLRSSKRKSDLQDNDSQAIQQMLDAGFIVQNADGSYGPGPAQQQVWDVLPNRFYILDFF